MSSHDPRDPLDADERELAGRLSRLGPLDGPSPALDAKILAAAHAAATPRRTPARRRWLPWVGVPPAAITGMGVAAACVLALGVVWQMRPRVAMVPAADESSEEVFVAAEPAGSRAQVVNPPPFEAAAQAADASATAQPQARARADVAADADPRKAVADNAQQADAVAAFPATADTAGASAADMAAPARAAAAPSAAPPVAEGHAEAEAEADAAAAAAADTTAAKQRRPTYTSAARATAERAQRAAPPPMPQSASAPAAPAPAAPPPPPRGEATAFPETASPGAAAATSTQSGPAQSEAVVLDRVEVTGSRVRESGLSASALARIHVRDDAKLAPDDWLARIRARRDAQDLDAARESLRLFRRAYPAVRLPDDLRSLTAAAP